MDMQPPREIYRRGRGSNPASRANIAKAQAARNWYVFTRSTFNGAWEPFCGPFYSREAQNKAQALCEAAGSPEYATASTLTDAEAFERGALTGKRAKRYLDTLT